LKLIVIVDPAPAATLRSWRVAWSAGRGGGATILASSIRAFCSLGSSGGKFCGFAKKSKTSSAG
jgi:hypothetical protein